eukprot:Colp12_sorted_trinity150504_noHs@521
MFTILGTSLKRRAASNSDGCVVFSNKEMFEKIGNQQKELQEKLSSEQKELQHKLSSEQKELQEKISTQQKELQEKLRKDLSEDLQRTLRECRNEFTVLAGGLFTAITALLVAYKGLLAK